MKLPSRVTLRKPACQVLGLRGDAYVNDILCINRRISDVYVSRKSELSWLKWHVCERS